MNQLWRLHTRPDSEKDVDATDFCIKNKVIGIGWPVDTESDITDWLQYEKLVKEQSPNWLKDNSFMPAMNALIDNMEVEDIIWTRSYNGIYYLGECKGPWKYTGNPIFRKADIVNIRECIWTEVGVETAVPGKVVSAFIPSRTLQRVNDDSALGYSQLLLSKPVTVKITNIFSLLSAVDIEDVVALYLQECHGYHLIPSSRSRRNDTIKYEFILTNKNGREAAVQVKSGHESINLCDYEELAKTLKVFLFCTSDDYVGKTNADIESISTKTIRDFMNSYESMLPLKIRRWKTISDSL